MLHALLLAYLFYVPRRAYPPYGFFILNRMGMEDYVQHMYPEDDLETHGDYLMYRSYPDFTAKRLAMAHPIPSDDSCRDTPDISIASRGGLSGSTKSAGRFSDAQGRAPSQTDILTNWQHLLSKNREKGRSETVGLWMFATDAREPMKDVMMR